MTELNGSRPEVRFRPPSVISKTFLTTVTAEMSLRARQERNRVTKKQNAAPDLRTAGGLAIEGASPSELPDTVKGNRFARGEQPPAA